jgi:hypothetical protein
MSNWLESIYGEAFNRCRPVHCLLREAGIPMESIEGLDTELEKAEAPFAKEIARCVKQICTTGDYDLRDYSPGVWPLMYLRILIVQNWVWSMGKSGKGPVPFPRDTPFPKFAKWLFTKWWNDYGRMCGAENLIAENVDWGFRDREMTSYLWIKPSK